MNWLIPVGIRIVVADIWHPILSKKLAMSKSRERAFVWQYFFCALLSWIVFLVFGRDFSHLLSNVQITKLNVPAISIIAGIGLLNGFACYCQWRARAISLSKSAVMAIPDDIVALVLVYLLAPHLELPFLTSGLIIGVVFSFIGAIIFGFQKTGLEHTGAKLVVWVLGYTIIWGAAAFLIRFFAGGVQLPWHNFLLIWYNGSLVSALVIFYVAKLKKKLGPEMTNEERKNTLKLVILIWVSLALAYIALKFCPLTVFKPIFLFTASAGPLLVGFFYFKEYPEIKPIEKLAFILGGVGIVIIILTFPYHLLK